MRLKLNKIKWVIFSPFFIPLLFHTINVVGQDPQFSQFYAAPLYLNPAFSGGTQQARAGVNYRNQWPSIDANFVTVSAYADVFLEDQNSGVGVLITRDNVSSVNLQSITLGLQYSYQLRLAKSWYVKAGTQVGLINRSINFDKLTFGDQFDAATGELVRATAESLSGQANKFSFDLSFGGLFFSRNAWVGFATHHVTQPNQSLLGSKDKLDLKYSGHAGWKFYFKPIVRGKGVFSRSTERSIAPVVQYRQQGLSSQADVGMYYTFEPAVLGVWYRGIPFNKVNGISNNESIVFLIGFTMHREKDALNIGYNYDYTISKLGISSGGAHEITLSYSWSVRNPRKPTKDKLIIPCPSF